MTREDILRMAREAGVPEYDDDDCEDGTRFEAGIYALERFSELVAAAEREMCAKLCEHAAILSKCRDDEVGEYIAYECTKEIHASGKE